MSKSMLVIDTPEYCRKCPCCRIGKYGCYCSINGKEVDPEDKPEWCEMQSMQDSKDNIDKKENDISYCNEIKEWIHILCESEKFDIDENELTVEVKPQCTYHQTGNVLIRNIWELTFKTTLTSKKEEYSFGLLSCAHPKYVAAYAIQGYLNRKEEYHKEISKQASENKKEKWYRMLFD